MRDTQEAAWDAIQEKLPEKRRAVFNVLLDGSAALFQVAQRLDLPVHCVSGRLTELAKAGLIEDSGQRLINPASGKAAIAWRVSVRGQLGLFAGKKEAVGA